MSHKETTTLRVRVKVEFKKRDDGGWCVRSEELKGFAYGRTQEEAEEYMRQAMEGAVSTFTDRDSLTSYLNSTGAAWRFETAGGKQAEETYREFEVPVAVPA